MPDLSLQNLSLCNKSHLTLLTVRINITPIRIKAEQMECFFFLERVETGALREKPLSAERRKHIYIYISAPFCDIPQKTGLNTGNYMPYSLRQVCRFFYVPQDYKHWRVVRRGLRFNRPFPRRLESLNICGCNYKGSILSSVI